MSGDLSEHRTLTQEFVSCETKSQHVYVCKLTDSAYLT